MTDIKEVGLVLIKDGTLLPDSLLLESEPYTSGWRAVKNLAAHGLDRQISAAHWTFFYLAGEIQASAVGSDGPENTRKAIEKIVAMRELAKFNSLEITGVIRKRFLGVPYTTVTAHSRHIQESSTIFRAPGIPQWAPTIRLAA